MGQLDSGDFAHFLIGDNSSNGLDPLEYAAHMFCAGRVPHHKVVAQLCDDGSYYLTVGPVLNTVEDDHSTGTLDQQSARQTLSHPEPAFTRWGYYGLGIEEGRLRVIPELLCLQVLGRWWIADLDRETGLARQVATLSVANNPDHAP